MKALDDYLPYLLNRAGARLAASFAEEIRPLGANLQMWRVLAALHERDGRRMGDLAAITSIKVSTLTRLIDRMERKTLVVRRQDRADARAVALHVSAAGRRLTRKILPIAERYERVALRGFGSAETTRLKTALRRLFDNMDGLRKE
ncbi:MAG: MarR family transcriptional regulator [Enhydrobacter sp.]|nr:MAG: MarR family transcriptional regulator [Enhydrobacter sp.]